MGIYEVIKIKICNFANYEDALVRAEKLISKNNEQNRPHWKN